MARAHPLLEAVYDDPRSDDKRLALAEALVEAGDPRGELISLQLERARIEREGGAVDAKAAKREAALVKKHAKEWLGTLAAVTVRSSLVFAKGFLVAATFHLKKAADGDAAIGAPEWSTVRILARSGFRAVPDAIVVHPVMRSLLTIGVPLTAFASLPGAPPNVLAPAPGHVGPRMSPAATLDVISPASAAALFDCLPERPLLALRIYREKTEAFDDATAAVLANARSVPHLQYLRLALNGPPAMYRWLFGSRLAKQLQVLVIDLNDYGGGDHSWFGDWHTALSAMDLAPRTMRFIRWGFELHLSRDDEGAFSVLDVERTEDSYVPNLNGLAQLINQLPTNALRKLRLSESFGDATSLLEQLAREQTRLSEIVIPR